MRLKRLALQGYKTFASKTEFEFDTGITAIVGPNGSGKSNVADALRWVLGEQSYSTLRGKRTVDMIFAGSQTRPRAGMAQAILTLDNSDGWLPIEFSEIEIGRRAYRSGENEYILNGQKVRLRDITDLLATSGLAERTYTIIGQGLIDQALSLRAEERRALFEEAAGVSNYKMKRAETLRRLQETQHNLERVHDILAEIRPRLSSLKRQANRAENYEQVANDLRYHLRIWYGYHWVQGKRKLRVARQAAGDAQQAWEEGRRSQLLIQERLDEQRRAISRLQRQIQEHETVRESMRAKLESARQEVAVLTERQVLYRRQLSDLELELPRLQEQQAAAQLEINAAVLEFEKAQATLIEQQSALQVFQAGFLSQQSAIDHSQAEIARLEREQQAGRKQLAQAEGQLSQLQERLAEYQTSLTKADDLDQALTKVEQCAAALQKAQETITTLRQRRSELQLQRQEGIQKLRQQRQSASEIEKRLNSHNSELARLQTRLELLDRMRRKDAEIEAGIPVVGKLASLISIPTVYRIAVETALAARLATVLLPTQDSLWRLFDSQLSGVLIAAAADRITPPPAVEKPDRPAVIGWADELVTFDPQAKALVRLLLGRTLVVQDPQAAFDLAHHLPPGAVAVTLNGLLVHAGGLAERQPIGSQDSVLAREEEWRAAKSSYEALEAERVETRNKLEEHARIIRELQAAVDQLNAKEQELGKAEQSAQQLYATAQRELDRAQQQHDYLGRQRDKRVEEIGRLQQRIAEIRQSFEQQQIATSQIGAELEKAQMELSGLPVSEAREQRRSLQQQIEAAQTIVSGRQAVVDSRRATLNQVDELLHRRQSRFQELSSQVAQLDLTRAQEALSRLQTETDMREAALRPVRERLAAAQAALEAQEEAMAAGQRQGHELENRFTQARINLSQRENSLEGLRERIRADLGLVALHYDDDLTGQSPLPIAEVVEELPELEELPEDIEETIQRYRGQLNRMGAVNPDAPAEYAETQARFEFLTQQVEDLHQTQIQLRRVIDQLDEFTSRAFAETVEKVDRVFGTMFKRLFGGGSAQLVLTEPDDLTVSGVDIVARLPSRREQGLALLSGGERSLTAAALVFALLKVSPTPFCVLDEVDAMLDEANVNRFREVLRELSANTQIIVITHNRGTVEVSQTVYGISMGGDSASQVISVKPEEYIRRQV